MIRPQFKTYKYWIKAYCEVEIEAESKEEGRMKLLEDHDLFLDSLTDSLVISDGVRIK